MGRVLLVKLGAIGDTLMLLPAVKALHEQGHEIEWLCGRQVAPLLALYPWIRTIVAEERGLLQGTALERLRALTAVWRGLAGRRYDLVATIYYDPRYRLLTALVRAERRLSLSAEDRSRRLLPGRHHSDEYARILLERKDDVQVTSLPPVPPPVMPPSPVPLREGKQRVVLVPGGARNLIREDALRRWPVESFTALAKALLREGYEVVLSGGEKDRWAAEAFRGMAVLDLIGEHSLVETLGLFQESDVVVTPDSGPLHLAGLTAASVVGLFGPTSPGYFLPRREGVVGMWGGEGFACRPCYDGKDYAPCHNNLCIQEVTPEMVAAEVGRLARARREAGRG